MDFTIWEFLADNIAAWKQELPSSLKKGGTRLQRNFRRETQAKEGVIKCTPKLMSLFSPAKAAAATASHTSNCTATPEGTHTRKMSYLSPRQRRQPVVLRGIRTGERCHT